jgi:hypothetical protein
MAAIDYFIRIFQMSTLQALISSVFGATMMTDFASIIVERGVPLVWLGA